MLVRLVLDLFRVVVAVLVRPLTLLLVCAGMVSLATAATGDRSRRARLQCLAARRHIDGDAAHLS
jgi:hypothetical protein